MEFLREYGVATHIYIPIPKRAVVDFAVGADWTPASGDVKISKDGGAAANVTNLPSAITMGNTAMWDFSITATEMQSAQVMITVSDSATKAVEDQFFTISTYGNASARHKANLNDSVRLGLTALPNAAAEAAGGLYTRGSGAGQINQPANGMVDTNNVRFGGTAGTYSGGRPEVNTTHVGGTIQTTGQDIVANISTLLTRIPSALFSGITSLAQWLGLLAGKQTGNSTARTELRATGAGSGTFDETTDSQEALRDRGDAAWITATGIPTAAAIADAVWEEALADHEGTAGSVAEALADAGGSGASAADIADAVLDEVLSGHTTAGTLGKAISDIDTHTDTETGAAAIRAAVGLAAANLDTQLAAIDDFLDTEVAAIKAKTDNLPSDPADASDIAAAFGTVNTTLAAIAAYIDTEVAAIKAKTDNLPTDPADASDIAASFATIASTLSTLAGYIDTEVAAIKAKTDQLTFTAANQVDANVQAVNDVQLQGTGTLGDEMRPV